VCVHIYLYITVCAIGISMSFWFQKPRYTTRKHCDIRNEATKWRKGYEIITSYRKLQPDRLNNQAYQTIYSSTLNVESSKWQRIKWVLAKCGFVSQRFLPIKLKLLSRAVSKIMVMTGSNELWNSTKLVAVMPTDNLLRFGLLCSLMPILYILIYWQHYGVNLLHIIEIVAT